MRFGIRHEIDWEYLGATLAQSGDDEQVQFIRAFLKECRSWGTSFQVEKQLAAVNHQLTSDEREALGMLSFNEGES